MKKICFLLTLFLATALTVIACRTSEPPQPEGDPIGYTLEQVDKEQRFSIHWVNDPPLTQLEVVVTHGEQTVITRTVTGDALQDGCITVDAYYGQHTVTLTATDADGKTHRESAEIVLTADHYVIAPLSGSMPQLYFTLYMREITADHTLPAFVWLARPQSWNWDALPENVYPMPTVNISEVLTHNNYDRMVEVTDAYIEELYSLNPHAKFDLYINDYNAYLYLKLMVGNGIPEENYHVTLLSDGSASAHEFNLAFNGESEDFHADATYAAMAENLRTLYAEVREARDYNWTQPFTVDTTAFRQYAYVCAKEMDNVEWWLPRPRDGVLRSPDEDFIRTVLDVDTVKTPHPDRRDNVIIERNFAAPLSLLNDEEKADLKALYRFGDDLFAAAKEQNKKAMMILGSWADDENEPHFEGYVHLVKAYYGDKFVYFYKGHPNTPTALHPHKQAQLTQLGLIDVDSSINAELILFFYPHIYMCGYPSSTFTSVQSEQMAGVLFNVSKSTADTHADYDAYKHLIGCFATHLQDPAATPYASLCPDADHTYFLMEFNRKDRPSDIGIYDATANTITYYNVVDGSFVKAGQ